MSRLLTLNRRQEGLLAVVFAVLGTVLYGAFPNLDTVLLAGVIMASIVWYLVALLLIERATRPPEGFVDLEHIQKTGDDDTDRILRDDQTVVEDKRTGERYVATREGVGE